MTELQALQENVLHFIRREGLIKSGDHVLTAVSGGPDSVTLLDVLASLRDGLELSRITILHFNHQLRGKASDEDEDFARSLATRFGFPFYCHTQDVDSYRSSRRISMEMAARACRHEFFRAAREELAADKIALGHTANDQAEEILLRLFRGTGPSGLAGMLPRGNYGIIRPLLSTSRREILHYLRLGKLDFREDPTNTEAVCQRNRLRLDIFPVLEKCFHHRVADNLCRHGQLVRIEEEYWALQVRSHWPVVCAEEGPSRIVLNVPTLVELHPAMRKRIIRFAIERLQGHLQRIYAAHVELLCRLVTDDRPGKAVHLPGRLRATRRGDSLILSTELSSGAGDSAPRIAFMETIPGPGGFSFAHPLLDLSVTHVERPVEKDIPRQSPDLAWLDASKIVWPLVIRSWHPGDRFRPLGLSGSKKLQDFFTDVKVPREERSRIPLLCDREKICWVMGYRLDDRVKVTSLTRSVLLVERHIPSSLTNHIDRSRFQGK
jgi:tRNA(Ile)-lysidine synthase